MPWRRHQNIGIGALARKNGIETERRRQWRVWRRRENIRMATIMASAAALMAASRHGAYAASQNGIAAAAAKSAAAAS
jgi:hypothetical protein